MSDDDIRRPRLRSWFLATFLIFITWLLLGSILTGLVASRFGLDLTVLAATDEESLKVLATYPAWQSALAILISFAPLLGGTILMHRIFLRAPVRTLFTSRSSGFGADVRLGALVMAGLLIAFAIPDLFFNRDDYELTFNLKAFIPYVIMAILFIPMQTTAEEVFYRGWIQQRLDNGSRSIWLVSTFNGLLFAAPHMANPEVKGEFFLAIIGYGSTGFMFAWVTMRRKSMGVAVGAHAANNLMAGLIITSSDSALPAASIWTTPAVSWGPAAFVSLITIPIFIWLTGRWAAKVAE